MAPLLAVRSPDQNICALAGSIRAAVARREGSRLIWRELAGAGAEALRFYDQR
ncbi:hypothetical protein ACFVXE_08915 [Streptomyces sp. NPDC058231]|uniref:hypothetical protein n=1 Tax=Streptomyces sp. NPDC058231 TaxID=3346392 RepID=UPI0036EAF4EE